jgi:hypothetical protein
MHWSFSTLWKTPAFVFGRRFGRESAFVFAVVLAFLSVIPLWGICFSPTTTLSS